jgi:hypothetical protein
VARQLVITEEASATSNRKGHYNPVATLKVTYTFTHFLHNAHKLMAEHHRAGLGNATVVNVQVGAANGGAGHADNSVAGLFNLGIVHVVNANIFHPVKHECFHSDRVGFRKRAEIGAKRPEY